MHILTACLNLHHTCTRDTITAWFRHDDKGAGILNDGNIVGQVATCTVHELEPSINLPDCIEADNVHDSAPMASVNVRNSVPNVAMMPLMTQPKFSGPPQS